VKKIATSFTNVLALISLFAAFPSIAFAQPDDDKKILLMFFKEEELVMESATRGLKPITQIAENVKIVTADDIKLMNAHTVADVLNSVTGVQVFMTGGPGSSALASIQGSDNRHVAVFMDGIPLNNLSDNVTDLGTLPVQNIEKIEIIKGPASSAWGSALGGVVNIITKSENIVGTRGLVSASYGEQNTGDFRLEILGNQDRLGYYITAGRLQSDGFRPHNEFTGESAYTKLSYFLTKSTSMLFSLGYDKFKRGIVEVPAFDFFINNTVEAVRSTLSMKSKLTEETEVNLSLWQLRQSYANDNLQLSTGLGLSKDTYKDKGYGASANLTWKNQQHNIVMGADFDSKQLESSTITGGEQGLAKSALYANDSMSIERLSVTPGIRYDKTDTNGNFTSPSLGATYKITDTTLLRAYASRGFSIPPLASTYGDSLLHLANPDLKMERVWSYQAGLETTALKSLWFKLSLFRNDIEDVIVNEQVSSTAFIAVNKGKERRQGIDAEIKTEPVYHTSISAGAAFMNAKNRDSSETIPNSPQRTYDVGLQYDDNFLKVLFKTHYIYWNSDLSVQGKYDAFISDIHVIGEIYSHHDQRLDAFIDIHNMFDGAQYPLAIYKNPGRWIEAGVRCSF
jgi:vitamin B12 transporter